eukprot:1181890-Prorocentrum_minimum.AAC.2
MEPYARGFFACGNSPVNFLQLLAQRVGQSAYAKAPKLSGVKVTGNRERLEDKCRKFKGTDVSIQFGVSECIWNPQKIRGQMRRNIT